MKIEITDEAKALKYLPAMVNLLRTIPRPRFDLSAWAKPAEVTKERPCGTTACAVGYAALHPFFKGTRIKLAPKIQSLFGGESCPLDTGCSPDEWVFDAIGRKYGISDDAATRYFDGDEYPCSPSLVTPKQVAQRIERDLISTVGKAKYLKALRATKHVKYTPPTKAQLKRIGLWQEQEA